MSCYIRKLIIFPLTHTLRAAGVYSKINSTSSKNKILYAHVIRCSSGGLKCTQSHFSLNQICTANIAFFLFNCTQSKQLIRMKEEDRHMHCIYSTLCQQSWSPLPFCLQGRKGSVHSVSASQDKPNSLITFSYFLSFRHPCPMQTLKKLRSMCDLITLIKSIQTEVVQ